MSLNRLFLDSSDQLIKMGWVGKKGGGFVEEVELQQFDRFFVILDQFLEKNQVKVEEVDEIIVNRGPGSFMGVRLAVMVAKTLAYLNKCRLFGVDSFTLFELNIKNLAEYNINHTYLWVKPLQKSNFIFLVWQNGKRMGKIQKMELNDGELMDKIKQNQLDVWVSEKMKQPIKIDKTIWMDRIENKENKENKKNNFSNNSSNNFSNNLSNNFSNNSSNSSQNPSIKTSSSLDKIIFWKFHLEHLNFFLTALNSHYLKGELKEFELTPLYI